MPTYEIIVINFIQAKKYFFKKSNTLSLFLVLSLLLFQTGCQKENSRSSVSEPSTPSTPPVIYVGTASGLSISTDGGVSFVNKTAADGLGHNDVSSVYVSGAGILGEFVLMPTFCLLNNRKTFGLYTENNFKFFSNSAKFFSILLPRISKTPSGPGLQFSDFPI